jgi:hypothetical protein
MTKRRVRSDKPKSEAVWRKLAYLCIPALRVVFGLFFERRYLQGRYFDRAFTGWRWALRAIWYQKILGFNRHIPWPISPFITVSDPERVHFHPNDLHNFQTFGCYYQCFRGHIFLGEGVRIAPNVGLITANHDFDDLDGHGAAADIHIGPRSWIGMNAVLLPGVCLGPHTVVGAGAVVSKSFPGGYCVVGGVPARLIHDLPREGRPDS